MPQPKRSTARSGAARKPAAKRSTAARKTTAAKRPTAAKRSTAAKRPSTAKRKTATKRTTARKATGTRKASAAPRASAAEARAEERIRELNERAITAGKELGTAALDAYESVLKTIAKTLESGPGRSDVEWVARAGKVQGDIVQEALKLVPRARKALK